MPCIIYLFADASVLEEGGWRWTLRGSSKPIALLASGIAGFMIVLFGFPQNLPLTAITFGWGPITAIVSFLRRSILQCATASSDDVFYSNGLYLGHLRKFSLRGAYQGNPWASDRAAETKQLLIITKQV